MKRRANWRLLTLPSVIDERGALFFAEAGKHIPFNIERFFFIRDVPRSVTRGGHAHKASGQVHVCVSGSVKIELDDGAKRETIVLDSPQTALHLSPLVWHTMSDFSPDAVLLVITSNRYDESEYVRDYDTFTKLAR